MNYIQIINNPTPFIEQNNNDSLQFITCSNKHNGKSTLIGRLLKESKYIFMNKSKFIEKSQIKQCGIKDAVVDFHNLAYHIFSTERRRYIVTDTSWSDECIINLAIEASNAQLVLILIDATKGVFTQTRYFSQIVSMMGISHVVLAINKMDLVEFDEEVFRSIEKDYRNFAGNCHFASIQSIPISALSGDNIKILSERMPWYTGPTLLGYLDMVQVGSLPALKPETFCMPVQSVKFRNPDLQDNYGYITEGVVRPGNIVRVLPLGVTSRVKEIIFQNRQIEQGKIGDSVTMTLDKKIDICKGDVIAAVDNPSEVADQFEAKLLWMADQPMVPGRTYLLKLHNKEVNVIITKIKYQLDINTGAHLAAKTLSRNEIAVVHLSTRQPVVFEPYSFNHTMGGFIIMNKVGFEKAGVGVINFALRRASNIHWQAMEIDKKARANLKCQRPRCVWFTGFSGSGKSTIANMLEKRLHAEGKHTYVLDGDNVRHGLNRDLGFTEADRVENIRRIAEVAKLMVDAGLIVLVSFISPFRDERGFARELFAENEFIEVFVDTPLEECERRDPKGLYAKVRRGELKNFTGIDSIYEPPQSPEIHLFTTKARPEECVETIMHYLLHH